MLKSALVVDDVESDLYLAQISLKNSQLVRNIYTAGNGKEAIRFLQQFTSDSPPKGLVPPEVIFIDLIMPEMDGFELMEAFRPLSRLEPFKKTKVVVCTNSDNVDDKKRALTFPFVKYFFRKPFSPLKVKETAKALHSHTPQN